MGEAKCSVCMRCVQASHVHAVRASQPRDQSESTLCSHHARHAERHIMLPFVCLRDESGWPCCVHEGETDDASARHTARVRSTRDQLGSEPGQRLECCPACQWGWVCGEHRAEYLTPERHGRACGAFKLMNEAQLQMAKMFRETGVCMRAHVVSTSR